MWLTFNFDSLAQVSLQHCPLHPGWPPRFPDCTCWYFYISLSHFLTKHDSLSGTSRPFLVPLFSSYPHNAWHGLSEWNELQKWILSYIIPEHICSLTYLPLWYFVLSMKLQETPKENKCVIRKIVLEISNHPAFLSQSMLVKDRN